MILQRRETERKEGSREEQRNHNKQKREEYINRGATGWYAEKIIERQRGAGVAQVVTVWGKR